MDQGIIGMEITTRESNNAQNYRRNTYRQDYGIQGYRNRNRSLSQDRAVGQGRGIGAILEITFRNSSYDRSQSRNRERESRNREREREEIETGLVVERKDKDQEQNLEIGIEAGKEKVGPLQDLDLVLMSIQTGIDLDAIDVVNMTTLQENVLMC